MEMMNHLVNLVKIPTISFILCLFTVTNFVGCSFIQPREMTFEQKQSLIFSTSRSATLIALTEVNKGNRDKQLKMANEIKEKMDNYIIPLLKEDSRLYTNVESKLIEFIPLEYRAYFSLALNTFHVYFKLPLDEKAENIILNSEQVLLFKSLVGGMRSGIDDFLGQSYSANN